MLVVTYLILTFDNILLASELVHDFKNPSFSGNGYSQHVLSLNQLEVQREQKVFDDLKSAKAAAERAEKNKTINKFITNVESRIYANLSKQLVDNMFGTTCDSSTTTCPTSGTATVTAPSGSGDIVRVIGYALSTDDDRIWFNPSNDWVEIA